MLEFSAITSLPAGVLGPSESSAGQSVSKSAAADSAITLLHRLAPGASRGERARVAALGYEAYLEEQLDPDALDDSLLENFIAANLTTVGMSRVLLAAKVREQGGFAQVAGELQAATLLRSLYSPRQLYEAMVEFWGDVLNIQVNSAQLIVQKVIDDREVPRAHALGDFRALLGASAKSPAMLIYLDNAANGQNGINENYSRELMELHTLGVDGGYSEADVVDVARALSGWTVNRVTGEFLFRPDWHDGGVKRVLGVDIAAGGGLDDGERVLDILAGHPSTAKHITTRLIRRFVSDRPSATLVSAVAQAFIDGHGSIPSMLRAMFLHPEVRESPASKFKRPQEFTLSVLRVLEATLGNGGVRVLLNALAGLAHVPFQWPAPNGYPDSAPYWLNSNAMLKRWNYAIDISRGGARGGWVINWSNLLNGVVTVDQLVTRMADIVGIAPLSPAEQGVWLKTALTMTGRQPLTAATRNGVGATLAALMLGGEAFQLR